MTEPQYVCEHCISDDYLRESLTLVENDDYSLCCDFCDDYPPEEQGRLFEVSELASSIEVAVMSYYAPPEEVLFRDKESASGWSHDPDWGPDIIRNDIPDFTKNWNLVEYIANEWIEVDLVKREFMQADFHKALSDAWVKFSYMVMHESRYFVQSKPVSSWDHAGSEIPGQEFLDVAEQTVRRLGLVKTFEPTDTPVFFRARVEDPNKRLGNAEELGSPKHEYTRFSNRMSPAGIPMFYGGFDEATAVAEVVQSRKDKDATVTTAGWRITKPLHLLDLRKPKAITSFYDTSNDFVRNGQIFLLNFAKELSRPVPKDGYEHINYAPTQVLTEYFRRVFKYGEPEEEPRWYEWKTGLHGIIYKSAVHQGDCIVLFAESTHCGEVGKEYGELETKPWIEILPDTIQRYPLPATDTTKDFMERHSFYKPREPETLFD